MKLNILKAFLFFKEDSLWVKKFLIGCAFMIFPVLFSFLYSTVGVHITTSKAVLILILVSGLIALISWLFICGYYSTAINFQITENQAELPAWKNFKNMLFAGAKYILGVILCALPFFIILAVFLLLFLYTTMSKPIIAPIFAIIVILMLVCIFASLILMTSNFGTDLKLLSFINYKQGFELVKNNWKNYLLILAMGLVILLIYLLVDFILRLTKVGMILMPFIWTYMIFVSAILQAQFALSKNQQTEN